MSLTRYAIPLGTWLALIIGILYLVVFFLAGGRENFAIATSMLALSLSIKAYGNCSGKPK